MAELELLKRNFPTPEARRAAFEDMATLMFCTELGLSHAVNRRVNQSGIESDPVKKDGHTYAYQAKYTDRSIGTLQEELEKSIRVSRNIGVTVLYIFVNQDLTEVSRTKDVPEYPKYELELEALAKGNGSEPVVNLEWRTLSDIQSTLDFPDYSYIRDIFLGDNLHKFYEWTCDKFDNDKDPMYGDIPLGECYIEPTVDDRSEGGSHLAFREYVESWVEGDGKVAVVCGEPGHGKTSLCRKAVRDFYRSGWLADKVDNVFCFSLNPTDTDAIGSDGFHFQSLLSWGDYRENSIQPTGCRNALVFLDGYDELLERRPCDLEDFVIECVIGKLVHGEEGPHVIITTRSSVVDSRKTAYDLGTPSVPIVRLCTLTKREQLGWIERNVKFLKDRLSLGQETLSPIHRKDLEKKHGELEKYFRSYKRLEVEGSLQNVFGIPIVFRMAVAANYFPQGADSIPRIFNDLFEATWKRYEGLGIKVLPQEKKRMDAAKAELSHHALRVYADDTETAVVSNVPQSPWVYSFYTTREEDEGNKMNRVGFLHRSFYHYFLACEILSWFELILKDGSEDELRNRMSYLGCRRLDETTLEYVRIIHDTSKSDGCLDNASVAKVYEVLKETDGFLGLPKNEVDANNIRVVTSLVRANNVFWNVISLCSECGYPVTLQNVNVEEAIRSDLYPSVFQYSGVLSTLQLFDLSGCILLNARLHHASLMKAHLSGANLSNACLHESFFWKSDLREANLEGADLREAYLFKTDLSYANLKGANLEGAQLMHSNLLLADFEGADLTNANFDGAELRGVNFKDSKLTDARFTNRSDLDDTSLGGKIPEGVVFVEENLEKLLQTNID